MAPANEIITPQSDRVDTKKLERARRCCEHTKEGKRCRNRTKQLYCITNELATSNATYAPYCCKHAPFSGDKPVENAETHAKRLDEESDNLCCICLESTTCEYNKKGRKTFALSCRHEFHVHCLAKFFAHERIAQKTTMRRCPMCRTEIDVVDQRRFRPYLEKYFAPFMSPEEIARANMLIQ